MDNKQIKRLLDIDEWETFECKRAAIKPKDLQRTVSAFANTNGGVIILGLEDPKKQEGKKRLYGISENPDNVGDFLKLLGNGFIPGLIDFEVEEIDITNKDNLEDKLLKIFIAKSDKVQSLLNGDTYVRNGSHNDKIGANRIMNLQYRKGSVSYESVRVANNIEESLNLEIFSEFREANEIDSDSISQVFKDNGLTTKYRNKDVPTVAAALLFTKNPSTFLKRKYGIKISRYYGKREDSLEYANLAEKPLSIEGPLLIQIQKTSKYFADLVKSYKVALFDGGFKSNLLVPKWVFGEAITNAVIHRDYSIEDDIQVRIYDDMIEVDSPGTYPGHINPKNIRDERFSRNPMILRALNMFGDPPNIDVGEGVDRMFKVMRRKNLYDPVYIPAVSRPNRVVVRLLNQQRVLHWDVVSKYLDENDIITNSKAREITGIKDTLKMNQLLQVWVDNKFLVRKGQKKGAYYVKADEQEGILFI
ncbi:hypothetical protein GF389_02895 [Candidatus Dojkabacteria bacterium]|nr:hypothetical protein [Candidatus Dojkabacteria bacterium]